MNNTVAIVAAAFGVARLEALPGITQVIHRLRESFPSSEVRLAFTSNQMRRVWRKRAGDSAWVRGHPEVPHEVLEARGPLAAVSLLQDEGFRTIVVQPLHIYAGEEYQDLLSYVHGLNAIRTVKAKWMPFDHLLVGRPALGAPGPAHPYHQDLERAARTLESHVAEARDNDAALVYVGHGNHLFSTGVYLELEKVMRRSYSRPDIWVGAVEGMFGVDHVLHALQRTGARRVVLRPLMLVAGGHARDDICGDDPDSWRNALQAAGLEVLCRLEGLGENSAWADIYVDHARDALRDRGLELPVGPA